MSCSARGGEGLCAFNDGSGQVDSGGGFHVRQFRGGIDLEDFGTPSKFKEIDRTHLETAEDSGALGGFAYEGGRVVPFELSLASEAAREPSRAGGAADGRQGAPADDEDPHVAGGFANVFLKHDAVAETEHGLESGLERLHRLAHHHPAALGALEQLDQHRHAAQVTDSGFEFGDVAAHDRRRDGQAVGCEELKAPHWVARLTDGARAVERGHAERNELLEDLEAVAGDGGRDSRNDDVWESKASTGTEESTALPVEGDEEVRGGDDSNAVAPGLSGLDEAASRQDAPRARQDKQPHDSAP